MKRTTDLAIRLLPVLVAALLAARPSISAQEPDAGGDVRLAVLVVVDQMTPEHLERFAPLLDGGFGRFLRDGRVHRAATHDHAITETGPGHASIGTAVHPSRHGIVQNGWRDRATAEDVYCAGDRDERVLTIHGPAAGEPGRSAANLRAPALATALKAHAPEARVVSIAGKDRAALLTAGSGADWALWWDRRGRGFVSSTACGDALPDWARAFGETWWERIADGDGRTRWSGDLPAGIERTGTAEDDRDGEADLGGRRAFPYDLPALGSPPSEQELAALASSVYATPYCDAMVAALAREAVEAMELGADEHVDLLVVGLSSTDVVGHRFGPYSREVADTLLRADRALAELFALLDERVGDGRWIAALTSDHGVLTLPEELERRGVAGRRFSGPEVSRALAAALALVEDELGEGALRRLDPDGALLDEERLSSAGADLAEARALVARVLAAELPWVDRAFTREELVAAAHAGVEADAWTRLYARSYDEERSPDVHLLAHPWAIVGWASGTTHGSPYPYDRAVPLAFLGPGFEPGDDFRPCATVDVLPTLLDRAGVPLPDAIDGNVLRAEE